MTKPLSVLKLTVAGLLIAVGILIPLFSPFKIILEPASFTLASHVAIFIAMFISPGIAIAVALGTSLGFFLGGFPLVVTFRAASHVVFAAGGAFYLQRVPGTLRSAVKLRVFSFIVALVHAVYELIVVTLYYFSGAMGDAYYQRGFVMSVLLLVGLGTVIHSMIDFEIAHALIKALRHEKNFRTLMVKY